MDLCHCFAVWYRHSLMQEVYGGFEIKGKKKKAIVCGVCPASFRVQAWQA